MADNRDAIRRILSEDWDPLGVLKYGVADEYDSYVPQIAELLEAGASAEIIAERLIFITEVQMALELGTTWHQKAALKLAELVESHR